MALSGDRRLAIACLVGFIGGAWIISLGCAGHESPALRATERGAEPAARATVGYPTRTMGTYATVSIVTADSVTSAACARAAHAAVHHVDSLMSNWTDTSEVARLNREAFAGDVVVNPEVAAVLELAAEIGAASRGAFDITVEPLVRAWGFLGEGPRVPDDATRNRAMANVGWEHIQFSADAGTVRLSGPDVRIDLGGIAKGYGVDRAMEALIACGVSDALVDISGNMAARGTPDGKAAWTIGLRDPYDELPYIGRVTIRDEAVATSGTYEQFVDHEGKRYGHILDPRTGRSADGLVAVTVVAPDAMRADAWGTALFVLGPDDGREVARAHADVDAILVESIPDAPDVVWVEESLRERFELIDRARSRFVVQYF